MQTWKMTVLVLVAALIFPAVCWPWQGNVIGISETHLLTVSRQGKEEKVVLYGIECPQMGQPFYQQTKSILSHLLLHKTVEVIPVYTGPTGTVSALLRVSGVKEFVNELLIGYGLAWVDSKRCSSDQCKSWAKLQELARGNRVGLWADPNLAPPWEWKDRRTQEMLRQKDQ